MGFSFLSQEAVLYFSFRQKISFLSHFLDLYTQGAVKKDRMHKYKDALITNYFYVVAASARHGKHAATAARS